MVFCAGRKTGVVLTALVLLSMFVPLMMGDEAAAAGRTVTLTYAESGPPAGLGGSFVKIMKEEIERHTEGRVTLEVYWQGSLLKGKEILNGVKTGLVDMGYVLPAYYPHQLFLNNAFALFPQGPTRFANLSRAISSCYESIPLFREEFAKWNQKVLFMRFMLPMALCSTRPFTSMEDLGGLRVRASSANYLKALKAAGATPVSVPWSDCYMALQTGTLDAVFTNYDGIFATRLDEPARHILTARELWVPMPIFVTINQRKWDSLSEEIRDGLLAANDAIIDRFSELFSLEWERIVLSQRERGCTVTEASQEDIGMWTGLPAWQDLKDQWIVDAGEMGIDDAGEILSRMREIIDGEIAAEKR